MAVAGKYAGSYGTKSCGTKSYGTNYPATIIQDHRLQISEMPTPKEEVHLHIKLTSVYNPFIKSIGKYIASAGRYVIKAAKSVSRKLRGLDTLI